jgi:uncharacterized cupredoxin-like copper-binding protein
VVEEASNSPRKASPAPAIVLVIGLTLAITLVLAGAYIAAAPASPPRIDEPGTANAPRDISVIMRDYAFNPSPLYLVAGETVRFNLINGGMIDHEFVIGDAAVQTAWEQADDAVPTVGLFATPPAASAPPDTGGLRVVLASGQSASVLYQVPATDGLEMICHLPGHAEKGMVGQVVLISR